MRWCRCAAQQGSALATFENITGEEEKEAPRLVFPPGFEPGTFRVLGERDNHYTTETPLGRFLPAAPVMASRPASPRSPPGGDLLVRVLRHTGAQSSGLTHGPASPQNHGLSVLAAPQTPPGAPSSAKGLLSPPQSQQVPPELRGAPGMASAAAPPRTPGVTAYPKEHGIVTSWGNREAVGKNVYDNDLKMKSSEQTAILTEALLNPLVNREKMAELFPEHADVPALCVIQAVLALCASGLSTDCVMDSSYGVTHSVPIFEGYCLPHGILRLDLDSCDLTEHLTRILKESGTSQVTTAEELLAQGIKEKFCYICLSLEEEMTKNPSEVEKNYHLPGGREIMVQNQRFRCPETLFHPPNVGMESPGIDKLCSNSIMNESSS
ncbi:LOW QUALITY PROTEIN: actin-related protein T3 [Sarcoramphus papa]